MFKIKDGRSKFYQWDLDRQLIVDDETITQVHFCNRTDECSLVVETFQQDGLTLANVPNVLLQTDWDVNVYAYDGKATKHSARFEVERRTKPTDYVYTETEVLKWESLEEQIDSAIADVHGELWDYEIRLDTTEAAITEINKAILNLYPKDSQSGNMVAYNEAEAMPLTEFVIENIADNFSSYPKIINVYRCGKNLLDPDPSKYKKDYVISGDNGEIVESAAGYACCVDYIPVLPNTDYVFSGNIITSSKINSVAFYDEKHNFIKRITPPAGERAQFETSYNCRFIRFNFTGNRINLLEDGKAMLEVGKVATEYEPYNVDIFKVNMGAFIPYVKVDVLNGKAYDKDGKEYSFTPVAITTKSGANHFYTANVLKKKDDDVMLDTIRATMYLNPTTAYNKLKAAIDKGAE